MITIIPEDRPYPSEYFLCSFYPSLANRFTPLSVEVRIGEGSKSIGQGWVKTTEEILGRIRPIFRDDSYHIDRSPATNREKEEAERNRELWREIKDKIKAEIRLFGPMFGQFEGDVGSFR